LVEVAVLYQTSSHQVVEFDLPLVELGRTAAEKAQSIVVEVFGTAEKEASVVGEVLEVLLAVLLLSHLSGLD
jgi:hypothetical protein